MPSPWTTTKTDAAEVKAAGARLAPRIAARLAQRLFRQEVAAAAPAVVIALSAAFLLGRLIPDVGGKPLFGDEVLAGLTALHPLRDLLEIVVFDRGGAPLHFVLAHFTLALDASPEALRWLSVVFALAAVPVSYDLGRRLGGRVAGATAAVVVGTSSMLAVYGSIGRMYSLFALASAVAANLFARALEKRTGASAFAAALAAWLLPAVHPYGIVIVAVEALVALAVWRGRPLRPALPVLAVGLALAPFIVTDLRLTERFGVSAFEEESVAPPDFAAQQLGEALAAFAGGAGATALVFFGFALCGLFVLTRRQPAFAAFALVALASIPVLLVVAKAEEELVHQLSPRHLMFGLPVWAALVGVGIARVVRDLPRAAAALGVAAVAAAGALAPPGVADPRVDEHARAGALAAPSSWVRSKVDDGSVLFFSSPVFLAALPETRDTIPVPRSGRPLRMVERADYPVPSLLVALPLAGSRADAAQLRTSLGRGTEVGLFPEWLVVKRRGPFPDERAVLTSGVETLTAVLRTTREPALLLRREIRSGAGVLCEALATLRDPCPADVLARRRAR